MLVSLRASCRWPLGRPSSSLGGPIVEDVGCRVHLWPSSGFGSPAFGDTGGGLHLWWPFVGDMGCRLYLGQRQLSGKWAVVCVWGGALAALGFCF